MVLSTTKHKFARLDVKFLDKMSLRAVRLHSSVGMDCRFESHASPVPDDAALHVDVPVKENASRVWGLPEASLSRLFLSTR
jgi:hypothetical protein